MPYRIYQFEQTPLPPAMPEENLSTGDAESTLADSVGGVYDTAGTGRRLPRRQAISYRGMYEIRDGGRFAGAAGVQNVVDHAGNQIVDHAGNRIVTETGAAAMRGSVDAIKGLVGVRGSLYRRREDDGAIGWKTARLLGVRHLRSVEDAGVVARLELQWETAMAAWRDAVATVVNASWTGNVTTGMVVHNAGNVDVTDAVLAVTATEIITTLRVTGRGVDWTWSGYLEAGRQLVIDAGGKTMRAAGVVAYAGFGLGAGHTAAGWLPLTTGANVLMLTANGAGSAALSFYQQNL